jgi:hypothetical protein
MSAIESLLTEEEAAQILRVCPRTLRKERKAGRLACHLIGRAIRYTLDDLNTYIEGARQCPSTAEKAPRSGGTMSRSPVYDFEAVRAKKASERRERLNARP